MVTVRRVLYALITIYFSSAMVIAGGPQNKPRVCLGPYLELALVEMRAERLLVQEEIPAVQLVLYHDGWSTHPIVLRAIAEEVHGHGARSAKEISQFLEHFAGLSEDQQRQVALGVVKRIQELVGVSDRPGAFKDVGPFAKRLGVTEADYRSFVAEWRSAVGTNVDGAAQMIQSMLRGGSQKIAQGVADSAPPRRWLFLGLKRDVVTKGTGEPLKLGSEPKLLSSGKTPEPPKLESDADVERAWDEVPEENKKPPTLTKTDLLDVMAKVLEKSLYTQAERNILLNRLLNQDTLLGRLLSQDTVPSLEFMKVDLSDGPRTFKMGSPESELAHRSNEALRLVTLTKSFEIQRTPVTQLEWAIVMGKNPSHFKSKGESLPLGGKNITVDRNLSVENVSYADVQRFIKKLNQVDPKYTYRLPTEAEWEYMARAGTDTQFVHGDDPDGLQQRVSHSGNSNYLQAGTRFAPNAYGLYDMYGNIKEWTNDWYDSSPARTASDPEGPSSGDYRVTRSGEYADGIEKQRAARRDSASPHASAGIGFRLVRTPREPE